MEIPEQLKFTKDHEWVLVSGDQATVGITDFAQDELGEIVFYEAPAIGKVVKRGETLCVVESTKAASDVYAPIGGVVKEVNASLSENPSKINSDPYVSGWLVKLEKVNQEDIAPLIDAAGYRSLIGG